MDEQIDVVETDDLTTYLTSGTIAYHYIQVIPTRNKLFYNTTAYCSVVSSADCEFDAVFVVDVVVRRSPLPTTAGFGSSVLLSAESLPWALTAVKSSHRLIHY